jgi:hypothetical protein
MQISAIFKTKKRDKLPALNPSGNQVIPKIKKNVKKEVLKNVYGKVTYMSAAGDKAIIFLK